MFGSFERRLNVTFLVLTPKNEEVKELMDFKPISLVSGLYKLIAKVLVNKLKKMVGSIVSNSQNAFAEGRQILDVVVNANEAIESSLKNDWNGLTCNLDTQKAYDHVCQAYLLEILDKIGFGKK